MKNKGRLIVIDGIDGSGKTTQINLLSKYLEKKRIDFEIISFPQYGKNEYASQIEKYLSGDFGNLNEVDSKDVAQLYASDRKEVSSLIKDWLQKGKLVIANRYASASKAHLGANIKESERDQFFEWLDNLEYQQNKIPKEDLTILLSVDPKKGQQNVYTKGKPDIHEDNLKHLEEARKIYLNLSKSEQNWIVINCMNNGQMKDQEVIHKLVVEILEDKLMF